MKNQTIERPISPWTVSTRCRMLLWEWCWCFFCSWTPKPFNGWRLFWLKAFGCSIKGRAFVHARARISIPWHVELEEGACVGDRANLYALNRIYLKSGCLVAQESYLCTGDHDLTKPGKPLKTAPITIGRHAFIGARAFVLPGVAVGDNAIVGAAAVVTSDVGDGVCVVGNPAKPVRAKD
jgi:putative colanic acid biosynthesis acetyltransferase WcaF